MRKIEKVGRFTIAENRGALYLRWWNPHTRRTESERLRAGTLDEARRMAKERIRIVADPSETVRSESGGDPTFAEVWLAFEQQKRDKLSLRRFRLLENRRDLYFKAHLWNVRMSRMGPAMRHFAKALRDGSTPPRRNSGRKGGAWTPQPLNPNTIAEIVGTALEVCALAHSDGVSKHPPPRKPDIAGTTAPADRDPQGRYLSFEEIGALIEACRRPHVRDLLLLDLGCGGRIGAVADLRGEYVYPGLGVIDLLGYGSIDSNKRRPIVPISGPMWEILARLLLDHDDGYLVWAGGKPVARGKRNWTQMIQRVVARAGIDKSLKPGGTPANWNSVRRTFADVLDEHASDADISAVLGHFAISGKTRRQLFEAGSPTTDIYKRRKLAPVLRVGEILDREWWPRIQPYTSVNLSPEPGLLMLTDAAE